LTNENDGRPEDEWRALDAPFMDPDEWDPIPGHCSRCGQPAYLGIRRWWHLGAVCRPSKPAKFIPD
jgi:hypothetical protein